MSIMWHRGMDTFIALVLRYILRYRLKVIRKNLTATFSYTSRKELQRDVMDNYVYLAKMLRQAMVFPTRRLLSRRMFLNPTPLFDHYLGAGKSIILAFGHTGNWEWTGSYVGMQYPDQVCALYKKIKSPRINRLMYNRRRSHVNYLIETKQTADLIRLIKAKPVIILMIADQNPGSLTGAIWADFLGRKTAFVNGPESLALRYGLPVLYAESLPNQDGGYTVTCSELYDGQESVASGEIMQRFAKSLEKNILACRSHWLWSHKRWKRKPKDLPQAESPT